MKKQLRACRRWSARMAVARVVAGTALVGLAGTALACADYANYPVWRLAAPGFDGISRPMLAPGNDTRVNLIWLMRSLYPVSDGEVAYVKPDWENKELGHSFLTWSGLRATFWPHPAQAEDAAYSSACAPPTDAMAAFSAALTNDTTVPATERPPLIGLRAKVGCETVDWAIPVKSAGGREYLAYLHASAAFYRGDWQAARDGFAALTKAESSWIAETAGYMPIRIALRQALEGAVDQYGNFAGVDKADATQVAAGKAAIAAYLKAWPQGRYAGSARGLMRRVMWLSGDNSGLAHTYEQLLTTTPADGAAAADLAEEIDLKLLAADNVSETLRQTGDTRLLLAVADLRQMRLETNDEGPAKPMKLTDADLAGQKTTFAAKSELYDFLRATRAYYVGDASAVLAAIPEDLRAPGASPLAFSRQVLRGMALAKGPDRDGGRFWADLIRGARPLYQRPFAELGLAVTWQQADRLDLVFAPGSPIDDQMTREILLQTIAPPAILRAEAADAARPAHERDVARFTLLYKDLSRQAYDDFGRDVTLVSAAAPTGSNPDFDADDPVTLGLFTRGVWSDGFACPDLATTARALAHDPGNRSARLCLGDFWRLNGFDSFALLDTDKGVDTLGHHPDRFAGTALRRDAIYAAILADPKASTNERAYGLYRAVMCYAPAGYNGCAGPFQTEAEMNAAAVTKAQRHAWFVELKHRFPDSAWAKALDYYW